MCSLPDQIISYKIDINQIFVTFRKLFFRFQFINLKNRFSINSYDIISEQKRKGTNIMKDVKVTNFTENQVNGKMDSVVERDDCDVIPNSFLYFTNLEYKNEIDSIIRKLNIKEQVILHLRFGFIDGKQHSLLEVGKIFGILRERVRQIEAKVLNLLLDPKIKKCYKCKKNNCHLLNFF